MSSFFAIGDWGYYDNWRVKINTLTGERSTPEHDWRVEWRLTNGACQGLLADRMRAVAEARQYTDAPFKFVVNVGDNFYPAGVWGTADPVWKTEWGDVYHGLPDMPWYSVYGNHDYGQYNRPCGCTGEQDVKGEDCAQVQKHGAVLNGQTWYMPEMSYYVQPLPGVNLEIVTVDLNILDSHKACPWIVCGQKKCSADGSDAKEIRIRKDRGKQTEHTTTTMCTMPVCTNTMQTRALAAYELLKQRIAAAKAVTPRRHLIINSHYPTTFLKWWKHPTEHKTFNDLLNDPALHITFFGGHVHATDNVTNVNKDMRRHGWKDYCVGGGGGWACDNAFTWASQGFVTGVVMSDGSITDLQFEMQPDDKCCVMNDHTEETPRPPPSPKPPENDLAV